MLFITCRILFQRSSEEPGLSQITTCCQSLIFSPYQERPLRYLLYLLTLYFQLTCNSNFDLAVKKMVNDKERDAEGWAVLFKAADARFRLQSIRLPIGTRLAIIEVVWDGESQC